MPGVELHLDKLRELNLRAPTSAGRPAHLSAASGLVQVGERLYVIADDEHHLGVFTRDRGVPGELIRLFPGELPDSKKPRKARKPDLEALCRLPPFGVYPHGALWALGSGSKRGRRRGVLLALNADGAVEGTPHIVDLSGMFAGLSDTLDEINIEGAMALGDRLRLLQRGNKGRGQNAVIDFDLHSVLDALARPEPMSLHPAALHRCDLGAIEGVPLCFSDGAALSDDELVFSAIAEDTEDNYVDGPCLGAALGCLTAAGALRWLRPLDAPLKVEGIAACNEGGVLQLLLVTDADDARVPAALYSAEIAAEQAG